MGEKKAEIFQANPSRPRFHGGVVLLFRALQTSTAAVCTGYIYVLRLLTAFAVFSVVIPPPIWIPVIHYCAFIFGPKAYPLSSLR